MAKSIHYLHMSDINARFKQEGLGYALHLNGACEASDARLSLEEGIHNIEMAYEIINDVLKKNFIKAKADEKDELHILID